LSLEARGAGELQKPAEKRGLFQEGTWGKGLGKPRERDTGVQPSTGSKQGDMFKRRSAKTQRRYTRKRKEVRTRRQKDESFPPKIS